jgi:hypothetical protein
MSGQDASVRTLVPHKDLQVVSASMNDQADNVIIFPGHDAAGRSAPATGRELRALAERLHLLSRGLHAITPHPGWTARQWMIASTQFRMRLAGTRDRLALLAGSAGQHAAETGYACLEAERALQAVGRRLDDLMSAAPESATQAQAVRAFLADQREALETMNDLRRVLAREVAGA